MTEKVKYTALTPITSDSQLRQAVNNIIANLAPLTGQHRDKENQAITWYDFVNAGYKLGLGENGESLLPPPTSPELPDMTVPPAITGFTATASFNYVTLSWSQPAYRNHSHVEIWRAEGTAVLADATFRIMSPSIMASDTVLPGDQWRYWARNVSNTGVVGPWTSVDGLLVTVPESPGYILDKISGEIRESDLYIDLSTKIDGSDKGVKSLQTLTDSSYTVKIDSGNAVSGFGIMTDANGRSDFIIRADRFAIAAPQAYDQAGKPIVNTAAFPFIVDVSNPASPKTLIKNAYIDQAFITTLVTGSLVADRITGQTLSGTHIRGGDMVIGSNFNVDGAGSATMLNAFIKGTMQSNNYAAGAAGWQVRSDGHAEFRQAVIRGTIYADDGYFAGTVYADKLIGDVLSGKVVPLSSWYPASWDTVVSASVKGGRSKAAYLSLDGIALSIYAQGGQSGGSNGSDTRASISGRVEVYNAVSGDVVSSFPFSATSSGPGTNQKVDTLMVASGAIYVGTDAAAIAARVIFQGDSSYGGTARVSIPAQSVRFSLIPVGSQFN